MLPMFEGASAAEIRVLSTQLSKTLKEKHNIFLKTSKVLNLLSSVNGFKNWHTYNAYLEASPAIKDIASEYDAEFEEFMSDPLKSMIPDSPHLKSFDEMHDDFNQDEKSMLSNHLYPSSKEDKELDFSSVSVTPKELFAYLSHVSMLDKSIDDSFTQDSSLLRAICDIIYQYPGKDNDKLTLSRLKHISSPLGLIKFTLAESQGVEREHSKRLYDIVKKIPGYSCDDAINETLKDTYIDNAMKALVDMNKLIKLLESFDRLPVVKIDNRYHYGNKMRIIGYKVSVLRFLNLDVSKQEYETVLKSIIDNEKQLKEVNDDKRMAHSGSYSFPLHQFGHKKAKCLVSQKNIVL